jgi:hypothetical protein
MNELRSIINKQRRIGDYLKLAWYFDRWYEKVILVVLGVLEIWKIFDLIGWL